MECSIVMADAGCPYAIAVFRAHIGDGGKCIGHCCTDDAPVDKVFGMQYL